MVETNTHNDTSGIAPNPIHPATNVFGQPTDVPNTLKDQPSFTDPPKPAGSPNFDPGLTAKPKGFNQSVDGGEPVKKGFNAPPKPAEPVPDTKEQHFEAIRYLIDQLKITTDLPTKATLDNISNRLDVIEGKNEKMVKW